MTIDNSFLNQSQKAFTMVELSVVLVILGLIVGGIISARSLIRASELQSITTEFSAYQTAITTFHEEYLNYPGDIPNATAFWGAPGTGTCPAGTATGTQTCNGNGDGVIDPAPAASRFGEMFTLWQHLANAGLIEGSFTGKTGSAGSIDVVLGTNIPRSKISNAGWCLIHDANHPGNANYFQGAYANSLLLGQSNSSDGLCTLRTFRPEDIWNIDKKMDDGRPAQGQIWALYRSECADSTAVNDFDSDYALDTTTVSCVPIFRNVF